MVRTVIAQQLPLKEITIETRMKAVTPAGVWNGGVIDPSTRVVSVAIARAGTLPSQIAFEALTRLLKPEVVRQDHLYMARKTDENDQVVGVDITGSKIGGDVNDTIVLLPDPMGATGTSMAEAISTYKDIEGGAPRRIVAMNLIVTPEYIRCLKDRHPDVHIYALRLDRGLSEPEILKTPLGSKWDQEKGLNEHQYIVPGAGGLGEILNNSYV
jgi:uracil phosphoribosyltransferase